MILTQHIYDKIVWWEHSTVNDGFLRKSDQVRLHFKPILGIIPSSRLLSFPCISTAVNVDGENYVYFYRADSCDELLTQLKTIK